MTRIIGPTGSRRRRRFLFVPILAVALTALFLTAGAQAVHDIGVFQLDGNASTEDNPAPIALEDWDLICKAHPTTCTFATGYTQPTGTTTADPSSFEVDPSESSTDDILKGGTKDDNDISSWKWASAKPSPPKNDITHGFAAEYECDNDDVAPLDNCTGTDGDQLLYFGADRFSNSGSANIAFWFFHDEITQVANAPNGICTLGAGCPFSGTHTEGNVSLGGDTPGDILVISAFGPQAEINVYEWVGVGNATEPCFTNNCSLEPLFEGGADCIAVTNDPACAVTNAEVEASPWTLSQKNAPADSFQPTNFFEGGLNLTELGIDACFSSFLINTRASAAGDAELHDKILGNFARCEPGLETQASTNGSVTPGTAVHDTATVTVTGASNPDDATGTVDFFLCADTTAPFAPPDCSTGGTSAGTDKPLTDTDPADPDDGISIAVSDDVNTAASPLAPGAYCFAAVADLTNYDDPPRATNTTTECFTVAKIPTQTVTTPVDGSGVETHSIALGGSIQDRAVVTGTVAGGIPTGEVNFFVCGPTALASTDLCTSGGTAVAGNPKTLGNGNVGPPPTASAVSGVFTPTVVGRYCFRAEYGGNTVYEPSSDSSANECFIVTDTTSETTVQNWLPNDSVTVSTNSGSALNGNLVITLREGSCTGTVRYTEPTITLSNTASGSTFNTTNGSVPATTFRVTAANNATPYFWRAVFTPTGSTAEFITGFTKCERTDITINDNP